MVNYNDHKKLPSIPVIQKDWCCPKTSVHSGEEIQLPDIWYTQAETLAHHQNCSCMWNEQNSNAQNNA